MTLENFLKSKAARILAVVFIAVCLIKIAEAGISFGRWLHAMQH